MLPSFYKSNKQLLNVFILKLFLHRRKIKKKKEEEEEKKIHMWIYTQYLTGSSSIKLILIWYVLIFGWIYGLDACLENCYFIFSYVRLFNHLEQRKELWKISGINSMSFFPINYCSKNISLLNISKLLCVQKRVRVFV